MVMGLAVVIGGVCGDGARGVLADAVGRVVIGGACGDGARGALSHGVRRVIVTGARCDGARGKRHAAKAHDACVHCGRLALVPLFVCVANTLLKMDCVAKWVGRVRYLVKEIGI